jgi:hypothetical protein
VHSAEIGATVDFIDASLLSGFQYTLNVSEAFEDANFRKAFVQSCESTLIEALGFQSDEYQFHLVNICPYIRLG